MLFRSHSVQIAVHCALNDFGELFRLDNICSTVNRDPVSYTHLDVYKRQGQEAAEKALEKGCEVYRLYSNNTEGLCVDAKEIADHAAKGGMLGISKESWMAALEKENYLKAAEMSMEDDYGMIDGIINNGPKEDKTAEVKAPERGEKSSIMDLSLIHIWLSRKRLRSCVLPSRW